jgi:hypothetical protein
MYTAVPHTKPPRGRPEEQDSVKYFRQQAAGGLGDVSEGIQHCLGCRKTSHNIGSCRVS